MVTNTHSARTIGLLLFVLPWIILSGCDASVRSSMGSGAVQPNNGSGVPALSGTGRFVAFSSGASNLSPGDNNNADDIFVRDQQNKSTELITTSINGGSANGFSETPDITPDGRFVVFSSFADDIVVGDTNGVPDVFLHDRQTGVTELISMDSNEIPGTSGALGGSVSDDGRLVAFDSLDQFENDTNNDFDVYIRDRASGVTRLMSTDTTNTIAAGGSFFGKISGDGSALTWTSFSDNIVAGDTNGQADVLWRTTGLLIKFLLSTPNAGGQSDGTSQGASISRNGSFVVFDSGATNLVAGDDNGETDVFMWDINEVGDTALVRISMDSQETEPNGRSFLAKINGAGDKVVYMSEADNLQETGPLLPDTNGERDMYLWERVADPQPGTSTLMSRSPVYDPANGKSLTSAISSDGSVVAFATDATNIGDSVNFSLPDSNQSSDIYSLGTFVPRIDSLSGEPLEVGQVSIIQLDGSFSGNSTVSMPQIAALVSLEILSASTTTLEVEVDISPAANPGSYAFLVLSHLPQLGTAPKVGNTDVVNVFVNSNP